LAAILYGDEDELDDHGRRTRPWFKPRWNEEMFLAQDYLSSAVAIETALARKVWASGRPSDIDDLLLGATSLAGDAIVHVPHVVCHRGPRTNRDQARRTVAVGRRLEPLGAISTAGPFETVRVQWPLPRELPLVS